VATRQSLRTSDRRSPDRQCAARVRPSRALRRARSAGCRRGVDAGRLRVPAHPAAPILTRRGGCTHLLFGHSGGRRPRGCAHGARPDTQLDGSVRARASRCAGRRPCADGAPRGACPWNSRSCDRQRLHRAAGDESGSVDQDMGGHLAREAARRRPAGPGRRQCGARVTGSGAPRRLAGVVWVRSCATDDFPRARSLRTARRLRVSRTDFGAASKHAAVLAARHRAAHLRVSTTGGAPCRCSAECARGLRRPGALCDARRDGGADPAFSRRHGSG
jgi:hypothetical protein